MQKHLWILLVGVFAFLPVLGQEDENLPTQSMTVGAHWSNRGPGLTFNYNVGDPAYRQWTFNLDAFVVKDLRETSIEPFVQDQGRTFVYGKLNNLLVLVPSVGVEWPLFSHSALNPINVKGGFKLGPAIGLLNPYQVEILSPVPGTPYKYSIEVEAFDPSIHSFTDIFGRANFLSSRLQPKLKAGLSLRAYTILDFTRSHYGIGGLIVSAQGDLFANPLPILAEINGRVNRQVFFAVSLGLIFGRAW